MKVLGTPITTMAFDSYYFSGASRKVILDATIATVASIPGASRFKAVYDEVKSNIEQSGDFAGAYKKTTGEFFLYHWDPKKGIGKMCLWTKAFTKSSDKKSASKYIVPGFDYYFVIGATCDQFNRALYDCNFPHRSGE